MPLSLKSGDMLTNFVPLDLYVAKPQKVVSILYMLKMIENCVLMLPHCCDTATIQRRHCNRTGLLFTTCIHCLQT